MVAQKFNYAEFYVLLKQMPNVDKESMVRQYTGGRTTSLKKMTTPEYNLMCKEMRTHTSGHSLSRRYDTVLKRARSELLHRMQIYGVDTTDWDAINAFCLCNRIAGKTFARMSVDELRETKKRVLAMCNKEGKDKKKK